MRKLFLTAIYSILFTGVCFASYPFDPGDTRSVNQTVSEGVYISSNIPGVNGSTNSVSIVISTTQAVLHTIVINSSGTASFTEAFNTQTSSNAYKNKIGKILTTGSPVTLLYDVYCSSGLAVYNYGTIPADITVTYLHKR